MLVELLTMLMMLLTPRLDVMNLQEQLDLKLQQRQARETGICQVCGDHLTNRLHTVFSFSKWSSFFTQFSFFVFQTRRELYAQCFDELIRQVGSGEKVILRNKYSDDNKKTLLSQQSTAPSAAFCFWESETNFEWHSTLIRSIQPKLWRFGLQWFFKGGGWF